MSSEPEVDVVWTALEGSQQDFLNSPIAETLLHGSRGGGKCLSLNDLCLSSNGWKAMRDVSIGDVMCTPSGSLEEVIEIGPIHYNNELVKFKFDDGTSVTCNMDHLWYGTKRTDVYDCFTTWNNPKCIHTAQDIVDWHDNQQKLGKPRRFGVPISNAVYMDESDQDIDPYLVGALIGDGCMRYDRKVKITSHIDDIDHFNNAFIDSIYEPDINYVHGNTYDTAIKYTDADDLIMKLKVIGLYGKLGVDKFIPRSYLYASIDQREAILQGLMDTDGGVETNGSKSRASYWTTSELLANDVLELSRSLGYKSTLTLRPSRDKVEKDGTVYHCKPCYVVRMAGRDDSRLFRLERKKVLCKKRHNRLTKNLVSYERVKSEPVRCFMLSGDDHLFLTNGYTVTHNTECALMAFCMEVGLGYGDRWIGVILRKEYRALEDVVNKSHRLIRRLFPDAKFYAGKGDYKWKFATGEELLFRAINHVRDYESKFHGQELPFILWEELTTWADPSCYDKLKSCNRHAYRPQKEGDPLTMPKKYLSTTNPSGVGHGWVKQRFIDAGKVGEVIIDLDPDTGTTTERVHIASSWSENPFLDDAYLKSLNAIEDENLKKAWLFGSWDVVAGGMFDDVWRPKKHIVEPFVIPKSWKIDRSFDWGSARPFCTLWFAESDGTDYVDNDGNEVATVAGDMFCILEDYGWNGNPNQGLRLMNREIAIRIRDLEKEHPFIKDWRVRAGPADTAIYTMENGSSVADDMKGVGIYWRRADKSAGSRVAGWQVIRQKLKNAMTGDGLPSLKFFDTCYHSLRLLPTTPRCEKNPDDVDTEAEDHLQDALRYRCRKKPAATGSRQLM